jgi:hypothetical protein
MGGMDCRYAVAMLGIADGYALRLQPLTCPLQPMMCAIHTYVLSK